MSADEPSAPESPSTAGEGAPREGREAEDPGGPDTRSVRVQIFGEEYVLRTDQDEAHTRRCAEYVDSAIEDAHLRGHVSEPKAAILAALEITDELFQLRGRREREVRRLSDRLRSLRERLEGSVGEGEEPPGG